MKYLDQTSNVNIEEIELVAKEMRNGKIAIFPTETVYGIGTSAFDEKACKRIYEIKGRDNNKPLIVLISNINMLHKIVQSTNEIEDKLIEKFWPGPLTIIFQKNIKSKLPDVVTAGKSSVGIRMTNGEFAKLLVEKAGVPIVAPSANLSGKTSGTKIQNIIKDLGDKVEYILSCGDIYDERTSTIVKVKDEKIHILRHGKISKEELQTIAKVSEI